MSEEVTKQETPAAPAPVVSEAAAILGESDEAKAKAAADAKIRKTKAKSIPSGIAFVRSSFNNTIVSITDARGGVIRLAVPPVIRRVQDSREFIEFFRDKLTPLVVQVAQVAIGGLQRFDDLRAQRQLRRETEVSEFLDGEQHHVAVKLPLEFAGEVDLLRHRSDARPE